MISPRLRDVHSDDLDARPWHEDHREEDELSFTLEIGLGNVQGRYDEVRSEIGDQLDDYVAVIRQDADGPLIVILTVPAADLWLSVLLAMAAITRTGYAPRFVLARPTADVEHRPDRRRAAP